MDPLELRYKNVYREGSTSPTGQKPEVLSFPEMLDILSPKYQAAREKAKATSTDAVKRGVGISLGVYGCGLDGPDGSAARIELNPDNTVTLYNTWEDHGQGADMGSLGTAHQALRPLGLAPEQIHLVMNDTSLARTADLPAKPPAGGDRPGIVATCELLLDAMRKPDGTYRSYDEMKAGNIPTTYTGKWTAPATACDENARDRLSRFYMYGVFMAEVAVETGHRQDRGGKDDPGGGHRQGQQPSGHRWPALRWHGPGHRPGPERGLRGHQETLDSDGGRLPYVKQIPDNMELIYVETPRPEGPFGAAGAGEHASDQPPRRHHQRHLQRLRRPDHHPAGFAGKGPGRTQALTGMSGRGNPFPTISCPDRAGPSRFGTRPALVSITYGLRTESP
jgi:aldehyde oxidoreductase